MKRNAVVIGSGFGGLSVAIRLQAAGFAVTLLEMRDKPGGRAYVYNDDGFTFDAGPTIVTDPDCIAELFALGGKKISDYADLLPVEPMYRLHWEDGTTFDYFSDGVKLEAEIAKNSPSDLRGYRKFYEYTHELYKKGYVELGAVPFIDIASMMRAGPDLFRLKAYRSVYDIVSAYIKDEKLRQAFSFHPLLVGGNPFEASAIYALIHAIERNWGVFFPRGGMGALVEALVKLFEDMGGRLILNAKVARIETGANGNAEPNHSSSKQASKVICADGTQFDCDLVVSNADVIHTYKNLLRAHPRGQREGKQLEKKRFSMSLFVLYFGLKGTYRDLQHHNIYFGPRYKDHIEEIFGTEKLASDFSLYVHVPTATDRTLAPPGCSTFYALSPVPNLETANINWDEEGPRYAQKIFDYLEARYIPNLKENLLTHRFFTPNNFRDDLHSHAGSAFSLEPILTQSAYFRVHNRDREIQNLYFVGAGTHPGAGLPGVIASAKATANLIVQDFAGIERK